MVDSLPHFKDVGIGPNTGIPHRNLRIGQRLPANTPTVFKNHIAAYAVYKRAKLFGIVTNLALLPRAHKTGQSLLNKVLNVGASVPHMIEHFVAELQPETFQGRLR